MLPECRNDGDSFSIPEPRRGEICHPFGILLMCFMLFLYTRFELFRTEPEIFVSHSGGNLNH